MAGAPLPPRLPWRASLLATLGLLSVTACDLSEVPAGTPASPLASTGAEAETTPPEIVEGPICVFHVVGTSNAMGWSRSPDQTTDPIPGTALMWVPTPTPDDVEVAYLDDPAFGRTDARASMWPAFARDFYATSRCVPFLSSSASGGGRLSVADLPADCDHPTMPGVVNSWHPDCDDNFDHAVTTARRAFQAAKAYYPDRSVRFGGWLWNIGNDFIDIEDGLREFADYGPSLDRFYEAFGAEFPRQHVYYIQSIAFTVYLDDPDIAALWDSFAEVEGLACSASPACRTAAAESYTMIERYAACATLSCEREYYTGDGLHWEWRALNQIGRVAGRAVGAYFASPGLADG